MINQKGSFPIILGVLIALLAVGGGAYYLGTQKKGSTSTKTAQVAPAQQTLVASPTAVPNTSAPADSKMYANSEYNFSIYHPSGFNIIDTKDFLQYKKGALGGVDIAAPESDRSISVTIYPNNGNSIEQWWQKNSQSLYNTDSMLLTNTLNNQMFYYPKSFSGMGGLYLIPHNNFIYEIRSSENNLPQILSTFTFTN